MPRPYILKVNTDVELSTELSRIAFKIKDLLIEANEVRINIVQRLPLGYEIHFYKVH